MTTEALATASEAAPATRTRRPRGQYPKKAEQSAVAVEKKLPEYIDAHEVNALLRAAPNPRARLLMMIEWRAGLRVSEALALEVGDLSLDVELPTIRVRQGKGRKAHIVPVHPELHSALTSALQFGNIGQEDKIVRASRSTADRWIRQAQARAQKDRAIAGRTAHLQSHAAPQLRSPPADERHPHQFSFEVARAQQHPDDAHLSGAGAGSIREPGGGAVIAKGHITLRYD